MTTVVASANIVVVVIVTTGATVAICTAAPLVRLFVATTAVKLPRAAGRVEKVTVRTFTVAVVTVPIAPLLNTTVLFAAVGLKPNPPMTTVSALRPRLAVLVVRVGVIVATCTAMPLATPFVVTMAVRLPAVFGLTEKVTVRVVDVEDVTAPTAPLSNTKVLFAGIELK